MTSPRRTYWANLLHFYQPYGQKREIIDAIVEQCYRPVAAGILANPRARLTINMTGVLLDQLADYGHQDVIDLYAEAARRGQVEFVGSAKYHTILPLLSDDEVRRQIEINNETNSRYLGDAYRPRGFFAPELAWQPRLANVLERTGFEWVMLDELAYNGRVGQVDYSKTYRIEGTKLTAFFREHSLSASIMSAAPRDIVSLKQAARKELREHRYIVTGMDGETFGHHRVGHEQLLFEMFKDASFEMVKLSDVGALFPDVETTTTKACTWASSEDDIDRGIQFISWDDPTNAIHRLQWELLRMTTMEIQRLARSDPDYERLRAQLDPALASDQFFWAAAKPWWMIEHIERGAYNLLAVLQHLPNVTPETTARGLALYQEIMATAYDWQRTGKIDQHHADRQRLKRIPFKDVTARSGDEATWKVIVDWMHEEQLRSAKSGDYEAAILWRDAIYKLEHNLDIYDSEYIIDLLQRKLPKGPVADAIARYRAAYDRIRGGQVEQRSN